MSHLIVTNANILSEPKSDLSIKMMIPIFVGSMHIHWSGLQDVVQWKLELKHLESVEKALGNKHIKCIFIIEAFHHLLLTHVLM